MNVIEVAGLVKNYRDVKAVRDISFHVGKGEIFGMLGPNGAGKTTTIECIIGLKKRNSGSVQVLGIDPEGHRNSLFKKIGVQLQETSYQDKIRVYEICRLFESFYENPLKYDDLLKRFGLEEKRNSMVENLSGGQKQRLSIILALISNPEIIFLDELTTGLDPDARRSMWQVIKGLKEEGRTVFMTTHYMEEAEFLCDRICIIDRGVIAAIGSVENIIESCGVENEISFKTYGEPDAGVIEKIKNMGRLDIKDSFYTLYSHDDKDIGKLAVLLENSGTNYSTLDIKRPGLDEAFLKLTGRNILGGIA